MVSSLEHLAFSDRMSGVMNGFRVLDEHEMFLSGAYVCPRCDDSLLLRRIAHDNYVGTEAVYPNIPAH